MTRLFGTDGIRAEAGTFPLDPPTVYRIGRVFGRRIRSEGAFGIVGGVTRAAEPQRPRARLLQAPLAVRDQ